MRAPGYPASRQGRCTAPRSSTGRSAELGRAAELAPDEPRYAYVYALGLDAAGERAKALGILADAHRRFTGEREILTALVELSLAAGDTEASARWAQQLRGLDGGAR